MASVTVRQMRPDDLDKFMEWSEEANFTIAAFDVSVYRACYPDDFFIAELDGQAVGAISGVRNDDNTGVLGLFIVDKKHRGKGIGKALLEIFKDHVKTPEGRNISVCSTLETVPLYQKYGFTTDAWDVVGYRGIPKPEVAKFSCEGLEVVKITQKNLDMFLNYSAKINQSTDRKKYFELFVANDDVVLCAAVRKCSQVDK